MDTEYRRHRTFPDGMKYDGDQEIISYETFRITETTSEASIRLTVSEWGSSSQDINLAIFDDDYEEEKSFDIHFILEEDIARLKHFLKNSLAVIEMAEKNKESTNES